MIDILREPESSLVTAIAKIGGLFALLRVSIVLNFWHKSLFVSKMNSKSNQKKKKVEINSLNESLNIDEEEED